ncbi:MAG: enoyl-CoA hydratase/isomerase family protein [Saprospiraceae bacterium]
MDGNIKTEIINNVGIIEFFHPSHNSLPGKLLSQLEAAIIAMGANDEAIIILLKSGGDRTFCAGASFNELASIENEKAGKSFFMGFANVINAIRKVPKLVIGRVQGKAVGGGVGIASACDYCMATKYASVKLSELAVGIGPFVIGPAVERKIGVSAFGHLGINATEWRIAKWAGEKGLFNEVFDTVEQLDEYIKHFNNKLVTMNPEAMRLLKISLWQNTENWDQLLEDRAVISGQLVLSDFSKKAIGKFLNA